MRLSGKYAVDRPSLRVGRKFARMFVLFRSRFAAVALKMLISSARAQKNVLHFQGMLTAALTFPFSLVLLSHKRSFDSSDGLSKMRQGKVRNKPHPLYFILKASFAFMSSLRNWRSNMGT